jgi:hypothetical protein
VTNDSNNTRKFNIIPDRLREFVTTIFGRTRVTKAGEKRSTQSIEARGDSYQTSMAASFAKQMRHNLIVSYRRNSRGLPIGVGAHQLEAALSVEKLAKQVGDNEEFILDGRVVTEIGESRLQNADTVLQQVKANRAMRQKTWKKRGTKMQRRATPRRGSLTLKEFCAAHTKRLRDPNARRPYVRPVLATANI